MWPFKSKQSSNDIIQQQPKRSVGSWRIRQYGPDKFRIEVWRGDSDCGYWSEFISLFEARVLIDTWESRCNEAKLFAEQYHNVYYPPNYEKVKFNG